MMKPINGMVASAFLAVSAHPSAVARTTTNDYVASQAHAEFVLARDGFQPVQHSGTDEIVLDLPSGSRLTFVQIDDDTVAMVELTESSQPPMLEELATDSTALEIFFHLGGTVATAPAFLWTQHYRYMDFTLNSSSPDVNMSLSNELRSGDLDRTEEPVASEITASTGTAAAPTVKGLYPTTCSFQADGPVFDAMWQSLGWNWHWYYSGQAVYKSTPPVYTNRFRTHLCNHNNGPNRPRHAALVYSPFAYISQEVPKGYRSYIAISQTTKRNWRARRISDYYTESGDYQLGAMAPP